ncbi:MAG TPA: peptidylprolyl isomerase [Candidatus Nanoarchaeia archaeon]|nr:peptidylprolyl isomerase [Candidatus Nanoarchaeia archaeon]
MLKKGDKVKVEYEGTLEDGTVFDSSKGREPLEFEIGSGQVITGFEQAVVGMKKGDSKNVNLLPSEAYGEPLPQLVVKVPRTELPKEELKPGMMLMVSLPDGRNMPAKITQVSDEDATIDFNHPLAGKQLSFKIQLIEVF